MKDIEDVPARVVAFEAVIQTAAEKAGGSSWSNRFTIEDVARRLETDVSARTVRRALKDAETLGWVQKRSTNAKKWNPTPRAEKFGNRDRDDDAGGRGHI